MTALASAWHWCAAHELFWWTLVSVVVLPLLRTRTPAQWVALADSKPRLHGLIRMMRGAGFDPAKFISGAIQALTGKVARAGLAPPSDPPASPDVTSPQTPSTKRGEPGFVDHVSLVCLACFVLIPVAVALAGALLAGCSGSAVQRQATAAQAAALVANRAEPLWIAAFRADGRAAADRACAPERAAADPNCAAARVAAVNAVTARWEVVAASWDAVRLAHGSYADRLDACRGLDAGALSEAVAADPQTSCGVGLDELARSLTDAVAKWRCDVRALGRADLDVFPGAVVCAADGGA